MAAKSVNTIAFQGEPGANSHLAAADAFPDMEVMPCATFEDALTAVKTGKARLAMIPIENSVAGRVADIHHLLPDSGLHIVGEHFERIRHQLLMLPGAKISELKSVHSHITARCTVLRKTWLPLNDGKVMLVAADDLISLLSFQMLHAHSLYL